MDKGAKKKVLEVFQKAYPEELSIKEAARKVGLTRETTSKYIGILLAEGKLKATRNVGNTKFFTFIPNIETRLKDLCGRIKSLLEDSASFELLEEKERSLIEKTKEVLERKHGGIFTHESD